MAQGTNFKFKAELDALRTIRDELKLKAHLAKADIKDELTTVEFKWQRIEEELRRTKEHAREPLEARGSKGRELLTELKQGYENVTRRLAD